MDFGSWFFLYLIIPGVFGLAAGYATYLILLGRQEKELRELFEEYKDLRQQFSPSATPDNYESFMSSISYNKVSKSPLLFGGALAAVLASNALNSTGQLREIVALSIIAGMNGLTYLNSNSLGSESIEKELYQLEYRGQVQQAENEIEQVVEGKEIEYNISE